MTETLTPTATKTLTVALAGNPNSGKTTIFNALTGLRQKVANYPGVTVEKKSGRCWIEAGSVTDRDRDPLSRVLTGEGRGEGSSPSGPSPQPSPGVPGEGANALGRNSSGVGQWVDVIDLPGTYSLISRSPDEVVAMQVLRGLRDDTPAPDVVICVVDASNLQRNLYLVSQLMEVGRPLVIALNMMDVAKRRGTHLSPQRLSETLGVPVVPVVGHRREGIEDLKRAISQARIAPLPAFPLPAPMTHAIHDLAGVLSSAEHVSNAHALAERLLTQDTAPDLERYLKHASVRSTVESLQSKLHGENIDPIQADIEAHYRWIDDVAAKAIEPACATLDDRGMGYQPMSEQDHGLVAHATNTLEYAHPTSLTDRLDRVFLHKIWGMLTFAGIMASLFVAIFIIADPLMGATEGGIEKLGGFLTGLFPEGPLRDLWTDGIVAGVGGVLVFVPQIAMLFLFLAILEDSGYLARAAFLMDRVLGKLGLNGKSFIPLLSSFACAIPGVMATRTIENRRDRLATIFVAPFMSCSARLPVYTLLIGAFFASFSPWAQGGIMFACYALGVVAAVLTALLFRKTFLKSAPSSFVLELPTYKLPQITQVIRVMLTNTWAFVRRAGTIIFCLSVILWAMAYYPDRRELLRSTLEPKIVQQWEADVDDATYSSLTFTDDKTEAERRTFVRQFVGDTRTMRESAELPLGVPREYHGRTMIFNDRLDHAVAAAQLEQSISGRIGHFIEPVIRPLGYDWKMGVGLIASFAAREVFVSQMGIVYAAGDAEEDAAPLEEAMRADTYADGSPVWTTPVAISLLVWFVLAMQCISTTAIVKRETGSWGWAIGQIVYMNGLAYVCALIAYQVSVALIG